MEHQKVIHLLNEANDSKFETREWHIVNNNSRAKFDVGSEIIDNTEVLKSNLCKLFGNTKVDNANGIFKNAKIAAPLQYVSNLWR